MYEIDEAKEELAIQAKYEELIAACKEVFSLTSETEAEILRAFTLAKKSHKGIRRKSGEPYIFHPLAVALIAVKEVGLGPIAVVCALLHDVVEDTDVTLDEIRTIFGDRVATIVDGVTKIEDVISLNSDSKQAENYRKILLSMCGDAYVIFLKLCDRLHNMRTLDSMRDTKKLAISSETSYLYIPLAHRLGLYSIKTELEDLVMKYTNPEKYEEVSALINATAGTEERLKECFTKRVEEILDSHGYRYTLKTRVKSVYSCWKKMERKKVQFDEIFDLYAMRIILDEPPEVEKQECYKVYSLLVSEYQYNPSRTRDWISNPKPNGYESLQVTIMSPIGQWVEVQIRSTRMDNIAEKGMAAHFLYKEAHPEENIKDNPVEEWLQQIRSTLENTEKSAIDLVQEFRETLYTNEITIFTPKGEIVKLPAHSTVLDFAFAIHTDLGLHCIGAKVNAKVESIGYQLHAGDQVQVLTGRNAHPEDNWTDIVRTQRAKETIKDALRMQRKEFREQGEQRLADIFKQHHIRYNQANLGQLKSYFDIPSDTDLFYKVATDAIDEKNIVECFEKSQLPPAKRHNLYFLGPYRNLFDWDENHIQPTGTYSDSEDGTDHLNVLLDENNESYETLPAPCCNPVQGDHVVGIVTDGKIMVHRTNCKIAIKEMATHENRIVGARWRPGEKVALLTGITFTAIDRRGLLQEITRIVSEEMNLNMRAITIEAIEKIVHGIIMLYVLNLDNLNQLMERIRNLEGVEQVNRI